jgi:hypothetical protein
MLHMGLPVGRRGLIQEAAGSFSELLRRLHLGRCDCGEIWLQGVKLIQATGMITYRPKINPTNP